MRFRINFFITTSLIILFSLCSVVNVPAASIKDRMRDRLPTIAALKDQGLVGENAQGYLDYRTDKKPEQKLIEAENNDRRLVYAEIAKQQGVDVGLVGQRRANQIAEIGNPGHWFRKADGSWYKK